MDHQAIAKQMFDRDPKIQTIRYGHMLYTRGNDTPKVCGSINAAKRENRQPLGKGGVCRNIPTGAKHSPCMQPAPYTPEDRLLSKPRKRKQHTPKEKKERPDTTNVEIKVKGAKERKAEKHNSKRKG